MKRAGTIRKFLPWIVGLAVVILAVPLVVLLIVSSGATDNYIRGAIVAQIQKSTSGTAELGAFHFDPWRLRVTLTDFTVHGREPAGTPPFFHAERLEVGLRVDSVWARKFSLGDVEIVHPMVHVRVERDGSINVPMARMSASSKPLRQRIFEVAARRLRLTDGELLWNDVRVPLVAEGAQFDFAVDYAETGSQGHVFGPIPMETDGAGGPPLPALSFRPVGEIHARAGFFHHHPTALARPAHLH